jgi:PAS domain S-box-containing protein
MMQAHGLDANGSVSSSSALQAQQMAGERLVNQCRIGLTAFGALALLTAESAQTRAANGAFVIVVCVLAIYSGVVWQWLKRDLSTQSTLKYVSVWIDISCLYALHAASLVNHSGAYEVFRAPSTWLMIGVFNGLGAVRYSARASLFSVALTLFYGSVLLLVVRYGFHVTWLTESAYLGPGLNLFDCAVAIVFAAVPAACSAVVAWHSEELLERSTRDAAGRASAEDRQRQILDAMADMILVKDVDSKIVWANRALREAWGTENDDLVGLEYNPQSKLDERNRSLEQDALVLDTRDTILLPDERLERKDGRILQVDTVKSPIFDGDGQVIMTVGVSRDVSDRKKLEAQLRLTETMSTVGTLAAGMAHEINNPLTYVIANLEFLAQRLPQHGPWLGEREAREWVSALTEAREGASRVQRIVKDLKDASRGDHDHFGDVDVEQVLESTLKLAANELQHHARVVRDYSRVPAVSGNASRLGQVFLNLLVNAAHAIREGAAHENEIKLVLRADAKRRVVVEIHDSGQGIPEEHRARLFEPFFTTKDVGEGTGLGLFICHRIVSDLGGTIEVESTLGSGSVFRVVLPSSSQPRDRIEVVIERPAAVTRRGRILVVDDDTLVAKAMSRLLAENHEVLALTSAGEALVRLERGERFDLIFCDLMMPVTTGVEFHERLLELDRKQAERTIFITGGAFTEASRKFLETTANDRLEKPFDQQKLRQIIARYLN